MKNGLGCLSGPTSGGLHDGSPLTVAACNGGPEQQWAMTPCNNPSDPSCLPIVTRESDQSKRRRADRTDSKKVLADSTVSNRRGHSMSSRADAVPPPDLTEAVLLDTIVRFQGVGGMHDGAEGGTRAVGGGKDYVRNVVFTGVRFAHAATTQLNRFVTMTLFSPSMVLMGSSIGS
jgi:hypothetical protein